jgi:2'-5' RNA ligase
VAVVPPAAALAHLERAVAPLREVPGGPRWTPSARWHLTLLFLGAVPADAVAALTAALGEAVAPAPPMTLWLAGAGRFGSRRRPQVAWAGVEGDVGALTALAGRLAAAARRLRLDVEDRPFRPHLTLGRWRPREPADGDLLDRLAGYRGPAWPVEDVRLVQSRLGPQPRYEALRTWPAGLAP